MVRPGRSIGSLRFFLFLANIFGLIVAAIGLGALIYVAQSIFRNGITSNEQLQLLADGLDPQYIPVLFAFLGYLAVGNVFYCSYIINFLRKSDDDTLINNRWILALFSLSVGGILTPMILAQMPNTEVRSTIDPKFTISKGYGINAILVSVTGISFYLIFNKAMNMSMDLESVTNQVVYIVFILIAFWGIINCSLFAGPGAKAIWDKRGAGYKLMNFVAIINIIYATIILIIQIILSILSIISIISDLFDRKSGAGFLNALLAPLRIAMQLFIIFTIWQTIKGIWSKSGSFEYGVYTNLSEKQKNYEMRN
ncbi:hypothetical protein SLITO_v1c01710 [Spiroplasma litorale]|uniref:Transmembrane protein n=1 Tax=Spiroplasma litorale TaxID=216942 RepID=A0A0K1W0X8_9MOLU|nr:hypothetical protein [Spiroplasma litorale]AKX33836.1 hypothetical protein SLITO_v1c01710 [Spiroplasma litorale]